MVALSFVLGLPASDLNKPHWWDEANGALQPAAAAAAQPTSSANTTGGATTAAPNSQAAWRGRRGVDEANIDAPTVRSPVTPDHELYMAANIALDNLIERLGRSKFEEALAQYRSFPQQTMKTGKRIVLKRRR